MKNQIENIQEFGVPGVQRSRKSEVGSRKPVLRTSDFGLPSSVFVLLALVFSTFFFTSCEDVIEVKLSEDELNLYGVEASISTKEEPVVFLYHTLRVNQGIEYPGISGAEVVISDNATPSAQITLAESSEKKGLYLVPENSSFLGIAGREYTVTIKTEGNTLIAKDQLSRVEPIDSIVVEPSLRGDKRFLGIFTYGKETPGLGNYYKWDIYINDTLVHEADRLAIAWDKFVDGNYISKLEVYTDFYDTTKPEDRKLRMNDTIQVKQTSISEFDYNFYFQVINQSSTGGMFSVPPANIKSNFSGSDGRPVLGLFVARDVSESNKVVIGQSIEDQLKK